MSGQYYSGGQMLCLAVGAKIRTLTLAGKSLDDFARAFFGMDKSDNAPIRQSLKYQDGFKTVPVDYHNGLQYPHLACVDATPDYLSQLVAARKWGVEDPPATAPMVVAGRWMSPVPAASCRSRQLSGGGVA